MKIRGHEPRLRCGSMLEPGPAAFRTEEAVDRSWQRCPILHTKGIDASREADRLGCRSGHPALLGVSLKSAKSGNLASILRMELVSLPYKPQSTRAGSTC